MNKFDHHHAFLIKGNKIDSESFRDSLLVDKNVEVSYFYEKNFSIDSAREISRIASQTVLKSKRFIIASAYNVGHESQNALLKTLEELTGSKKIIFFVENTDSLLPTFISRFSKENNSESNTENSNKENITEFSISKLLKEVDDICKSIKDEENTKSVALEFLDRIIFNKKSDIHKVKKLLYFKSCIGKPSASVKQILESAVAISA